MGKLGKLAHHRVTAAEEEVEEKEEEVEEEVEEEKEEEVEEKEVEEKEEEVEEKEEEVEEKEEEKKVEEEEEVVVVKSSGTRGCDKSLGQRVNVSLPRRTADAEIDEGPLGGRDSSDTEINGFPCSV